MQRLGFSMLVRFRSVLRFRFCSICSCLRVIDKGCARCARGMILMCFLINFEAIHAIDDFQNYSICFRGQLKNAKSAFRVRRRDRIDARTLRQSSHTHTPGKTIGGPTHLQSHFLLNDGSTKNVRKSYFPIGFEAQSPHITFRDFDRCSTFLHDFL